MIPLSLRLKFRNFLAPLATVLTSSRVNPNTLTIIGLVPAVIAGYVFARGMVRLGGVLLGISGLFDLMDGLVARIANRQTSFGALLDSAFDRFGEIAVFIGLAVLYKDTATFYGVLLALGGSLMVSYLRARAEGLGFRCEVGMLQRPERLLIILIGALLGAAFLIWAIWIVAVLANGTAIERLLAMRKLMGSSPRQE